jgi:hypothetical protein
MKMPIGVSNILVTALPPLACLLFLGAAQPTVHVASLDSVGPRVMEQQTRVAIVRDYLQAWQCLGSAFEQNRTDALDACFVGQAKETLASTIHAQQSSGLQSSYRDRSHDLKVVFYSPEGLSIELLDDVEYDLEVHHAGRTIEKQEMRSRYVAVLTPTESKWKVRIFQGGSDEGSK